MDDGEIRIVVTLAFAFVIVCIVLYGLYKAVVKNKWVSTQDFEKEKRLLRPHFTEKEFDRFFKFLKSYGGGYVRRRSGQIVYQGYLGKEKGDLKGIFFNLVVPNPNISSRKKEDFRYFLVRIGVIGVDKRPDYETRDSKLRNDKDDYEEYQRKEVGNIGEKLVRSELKQLEAAGYAVINGAALKYKGVVKEYDHIVIGRNGMVIIETKAFGMTDGRPAKAELVIGPGDKWTIRRNGNVRELKSPTEQILEEKAHMENVISSCPVKIHNVLALSNSQLTVKKNIKLPYDVVRIDSLVEHIHTYHDRLTKTDKMDILKDIDKSRVN